MPSIVQSLIKIESNIWMGWILRAGLDSREEVHESVKNFSPRQGYLRERFEWQTRWKNDIKKMPRARGLS